MLPRCPDSKHCENSLHSAMDAPRRGGSDVSLVPCRNGLVQLSKDTPPDNTETNEFAAISQSDVQALQCADSQENDIPQTTTCSSHQPESCHRNLDEDANGRLDGNLHDCAESRGERGGLESKENGSRLALEGSDEPQPARIVRGPASVVVVIGSHVRLDVVFAGMPAPRVTWTKGVPRTRRPKPPERWPCQVATSR